MLFSYSFARAHTAHTHAPPSNMFREHLSIFTLPLKHALLPLNVFDSILHGRVSALEFPHHKPLVLHTKTSRPFVGNCFRCCCWCSMQSNAMNAKHAQNIRRSGGGGDGWWYHQRTQTTDYQQTIKFKWQNTIQDTHSPLKERCSSSCTMYNALRHITRCYACYDERWT